jgi:hypothetical protein
MAQTSGTWPQLSDNQKKTIHPVLKPKRMSPPRLPKRPPKK